MKLTHNNWFQFGYNNKWFVDRQHTSDQWTASYTNKVKSDLNFREANNVAFQLLFEEANTLDKTVVLLYSGGIDSEIMLMAAKDSGIDYQIVNCIFSNNLNEHDQEWVRKYINQNNLSHLIQYYDLDLSAFFAKDGQSYNYARITNSCFPEMLTTMWLMDKVISKNGFPVIGSGEPYLVKMIPANYRAGYTQYYNDEWHLHEKESIAAWYRFLRYRQSPGAAGFFQYTADQYYSYLTSPIIVNLCNNKLIGELSSLSIKTESYKQWYKFEERPKYTGFEYSHDIIESIKDELHEIYGHNRQIFRTEYNKLVSTLKGK